MSKKPETPEATASEVSSVLSGGHPQGASGNGDDTGHHALMARGYEKGKGLLMQDPNLFPTIPQVGAYRTADHRYYWNGKGPLPSVTSILSVLDKPAVVQWAKRTVAEFAVDTFLKESLESFYRENGKDETVKWLARLPDYQKDEAGKLGSGIHLLADMASRGDSSFQPSELEKPYLTAFQNFLSWLREVRAEIISSEKMIWSSDGYAGTYDLLVRFWGCGHTHTHEEECPNQLWLLDIKTSRGYYAETALQLVAYGYADQIILEGNPDGYPMPSISRYGVLHLRPDLYLDTGWRLIEYPVQDSDYVAFLGALELYRWKQEGRYQKKNLKPPTGL